MAARLAVLPGFGAAGAAAVLLFGAGRRRRSRRRCILLDRLRLGLLLVRSLLGLLIDRLRLRQWQRHLGGRLDHGHRLDDIGLGLLRRLRRRLRLHHVRPRCDVVGRSRCNRQGRKLDDHSGRFGRAFGLKLRHQQIGRHQTDMRGANDCRGDAPAPELLSAIRDRQNERLRGHFASRSSNPTSATLRKPAERSAFITSITSP